SEIGIGSHIERTLRAEAEATRIVGQLERREPEIEEDAVTTEKVMRVRHLVASREVGSNEYRAFAERSEPLTCDAERVRIDVEPEKTAVWRRALEDGRRVATAAHCAIEETTSASGLERRDDRIDE